MPRARSPRQRRRSRLSAGRFLSLVLAGSSYFGILPPPAAAQPGPVPGYYDFELYPTASGGQASAKVRIRTAASPFTLAVNLDGFVINDIRVEAQGLRPPSAGVYVAWVATPSLDEVVRIGVLGPDLAAAGRVQFNKFIVFVTHSADLDAAAPLGDPILLRGTSRSGRMRSIFDHSDMIGEES